MTQLHLAPEPRVVCGGSGTGHIRPDASSAPDKHSPWRDWGRHRQEAGGSAHPRARPAGPRGRWVDRSGGKPNVKDVVPNSKWLDFLPAVCRGETVCDPDRTVN